MADGQVKPTCGFPWPEWRTLPICPLTPQTCHIAFDFNDDEDVYLIDFTRFKSTLGNIAGAAITVLLILPLLSNAAAIVRYRTSKRMV